MNKGDYVLWLPSWYPNRLTPLNGDFIQRHAQAASIYKNIHVVFLIRDSEGIVTKDIHTEEKTSGNLRETIIYYYVHKGGYRFIERIKSYLKYQNIYKNLLHKHFERNGLPQVVHLYVVLNAGFIIRWLKKKFNLPYVISEQWTVYLKEAKPNFSGFPIWLKKICNRIFKHAKAVSVVSHYLGQQLQRNFQIKSYSVIPNVVDENIFTLKFSGGTQLTTFLHVSVLNYQKNPEHLLQAFAIVKNSGYEFRLNVIGPLRKDLLLLTKNLNLQENILFYSEMPHAELVNFMRTADALILYSRYETFGCVLIEANACGVPVIVSDIPVFHENIIEGLNGIFAENENPSSLAEKLISVIKNDNSFSSTRIRQHVIEKFSFDTVGKQFEDWYNRLQAH